MFRAVYRALAIVALSTTLAAGARQTSRAMASAASATQMSVAWARVRAALPARVLVLQPAWLPARFRAAPLVLGVHNDRIVGANYEVGSRSVTGDVLQLALGDQNAGPPVTTMRIQVRGVQGALVTSSLWPAIGVYWHERGRLYAIQARGVSRAEMLRIVGDLAPVKVVR